MSEEIRKLATIRRISDIKEIPNADSICGYQIDGWIVVDKKEKYQINDLVIFIEIDSWVPETVAPFLSKGRSYNGVVGERLRTVKLRGQVSQGLILPIEVVKPDENWCDVKNPRPNTGTTTMLMFDEGDDCTKSLGIQKWEKELSANLAGVARGNFPSFIHKTNQERIQNLKRDFAKWQADDSLLWEVTEKLDGSSMTVFIKDGEFGVCSRNLDLVETEGNSFWQAANALGLREKMAEYKSDIINIKNFAIQGELVGEGIQGNKYGLKGIHFYVFDIFNIDTQEYLGHYDRFTISSDLDLLHSPFPVFRDKYERYEHFRDLTIEDILAKDDGASLIGNKSAREGLVFKEAEGRFSFKAIGNKWILKNEENG
jgi:RNA ligase (TIGR02306 family)